jgi:hypothetical protein
MVGYKTCSECGARFPCGSASGSGSCWCADYPAIMPADFSRDCRCPACLATTIARRIEERLATLPHSEAVRLASALPPTKRLIESIDYTLEEGNLVFTKWFLLKQGKCCGNGCRNCPYPAQTSIDT